MIGFAMLFNQGAGGMQDSNEVEKENAESP